jgi:hypothetical protein
LTSEEVEHHVRQLRSSRRAEPNQVAAALGAQGGGVERVVAIIEGSLAAADLPASTFESVGTGRCQAAQLDESAHAGENAKSLETEGGTCLAQSCSHSLRVIETVVHSEQPAQINEREAAEFTAVQHADFVARILGWTSHGVLPDFEKPEDVGANCEFPGGGDPIVLGKLNRIPKALREELSTGASLRACRDALEAAGYPWKLLSGTLVFVHPWQYRAAVSSLSFHELRPYNIIFSESIGYLLEEALARCKGSWMTACAPIHERIVSASQDGAMSDAETVDIDRGQMFSDVDDHPERELQWVACVQRTFLCLTPRFTSQETNVTSSTTDVNCSSLANPRFIASHREPLWHS